MSRITLLADERRKALVGELTEIADAVEEGNAQAAAAAMKRHLQGVRQFLLRGVDKVRKEWDLICLVHNVLKLFKSGWRSAIA